MSGGAPGIKLLDDAMQKYKQTRDRLQELQTTHNKYRLCHQNLLGHLKILGRICELFHGFTDRVCRVTQKLEHLNKCMLDELLDVFIKMKNQKVDQTMCEGTEETLLDFVDTASVSQLHATASQQIDDIHSLFEAAEGFKKETEKHVEWSCNILKKIPDGDFRPKGVEGFHSELVRRLSVITSMLSNQSSINTEEIQTQVIQMEEMEKNLSSSLTNYGHFFGKLYGLFVYSMEEIGGLPGMVEEMEGLVEKLVFEEEKSRGLVEEVSALTMWYHLSIEAHTQIQKEIERRYNKQLEHQKIIDELAGKLDAMWTEEESARWDFFEHYGRYLPEALCPALRCSTIHHQIYPRFSVSNLPPPSPSSSSSPSPPSSDSPSPSPSPSDSSFSSFSSSPGPSLVSPGEGGGEEGRK